MKIAAIVKAGGKQYSGDIHSKTKAFKRASGNVTSADLIQAMMESFRISTLAKRRCYGGLKIKAEP